MRQTRVSNVRRHLVIGCAVALAIDCGRATAQDISVGVMPKKGQSAIIVVYKTIPTHESDLIEKTAVSIRRINENGKAGFDDYGPSFSGTQSELSASLRPGLYEVGVQVPAHYHVDWSIASDGGSLQSSGSIASPDGFNDHPIRVLLSAKSKQIITLKYIASDNEPNRHSDVSEHLTCNISGSPMAATDKLQVDGSYTSVEVGVNRHVGNVLVSLKLRPYDAADYSANLIDTRSAGGAAWQTSGGGNNTDLGKVIHFNQAAGNSARNWGYDGGLVYDKTGGLTQVRWSPLYSNDERPIGAKPSDAVTTSPCYGTGRHLADGFFSLQPGHVTSDSGEKIATLTYSYKVRTRVPGSWTRYQFDFGMYLDPNIRDLRVYFPTKNGVAGPVFPYQDVTALPRPDVRNEVCSNGDCLLATRPVPYLVLVWNVSGHDIGVAIHPLDRTQVFPAFVGFRPHVTCSDGLPCGGVQVHTLLADTLLMPGGREVFAAGDVVNYQMQYDFGSLAGLSSLGFKTSNKNGG